MTDQPDNQENTRFDQQGQNVQGNQYNAGRDINIHQAEQAYDVRGMENPYLGLQSFTYADRDRFAGRGRLVNAARQWLVGNPGEEQTLLIVSGASGSGKSSLAQAGILPMLEQYYHDLSMTTRRAVFTPRTKPLASLRNALQQLGMPAYELDLAQLEQRPDALFTFIEQHTPRTQRNLIVLDQFEEVFTLNATDAQRDALIALLTSLPPLDQLRTHIIVTVRADYRDEIGAYKELHDLYLQLGQRIDAQAMDEQELQDAMHRPIQSVHRDAGKALELALAQRLARETAGDSAYLPLLHVTLEELWRGGSLTLSAYGETTLATAIQRRADTVLQYRDYDGARSQERPTEQQQLLLDLFTDLVKVPLDGEELDITRVVRRRLPFDEVSKGSQERQFLIDELSHARLLSKDTQRTTETEYVEVTVIHDALIREWSTLRVRIAEHAEELRKVERFRVALQEWVNSGKTKHYLLTGGRLAEAEVLQREDATVLRNPDAEAFLAASIKKRKGDQRTRFVVSLLLVLLVIGIGGAGWVAWEQQQLAAQEAEERERQQEIALSRELAAQSVSLQDTDPRLTLLLAMQSDNIISTAETRSSLLDALQATPVRASLVGHLDEVRSVAFSPDGQTLASGGCGRRSDLGMCVEGEIRLWDAATGQPIGTPWVAHDGEVRSVAFSPDGQTLASGSWDATVLLWDVTSGESISEPLEGHMDVVNSVAFSPDGQTLASGSWDEAGNTVLLWDLTTEPPERTSLSGHPDGVYTNAVFDVAFSPDGTLLAVGRQEKTILLWDVASRQPSNMFSVHTGRVHDVAFSPDGQTLASASEDTTIVLQSVGTGSVDIVLIGHSGEVYNVAFSPDGQTLVSSSEDNTVRLWDVATGEQMHIFSGHADAVMSIAFSPDGQTLVSGGLDGNILLWDMARGPSIGEPLEGHTDMVNGIVFSPNGQTLASGSSDTTILLWDVSIGQPISDPLEGHTSQVSSVAFSPDGQILASGSLDRTIILWDVESGQLLGDPLNGHTDAVMSIAFSPDGQTLVSGGLDGTVCLWDVATGQQINQLLAEHTSSIYSMVFSADGQTLALGKGDGTVYLWDVATQQQLGPQLEGHADHITSMAFSPDGQFLASGGCVERSSDGACVVGDIRLWSVETGQQIGEPLTENTVAISMAFSPDGQTLAAGNQDRTIRLWDVATGQPLGTRLARHTGWVSSVVFSSSGQILASGSVDGTVHLWDIPVTDSKARACRAAGRNLTWEEWQRYLPDRPYELTCPDLPPHPSAVEAGMWEE